jgi:hypothetical protein
MLAAKLTATPTRAPNWTSSRAMRLSSHLIACSIVVLLVLWLRWPESPRTTFIDADAARIVYGADLLAAGKLPGRDSLELDPPAASIITNLTFHVAGRKLSVFYGVAIAWAALTALGIYLLAYLLYRSGPSAFVAGALFSISSPALDRHGAAHQFWMMAPYLYSMVLLIYAAKGRGRAALVAAGALLGVALLFQRNAMWAIPFVASFFVLSWHRAKTAVPLVHHGPWSALLYYGLGILAGVMPLAVFYAIEGGLWPLVKQVFWTPAGWISLSGSGPWDEKLHRIVDCGAGFWRLIPLATSLAALGLASIPLRPRATDRDRAGAILVLAGSGLIALVWGLNFTAQSYLQLLPALVLLAAHPEGPLMRWRIPALFSAYDRSLPRLALLVLLLLGLLPALLREFETAEELAGEVKQPRSEQQEVLRIAKTIAAATAPGAGIWAWGAEAWSIYFHAEQLAPHPYYATRGMITTSPSATWRHPARPHFVRRGPWREVTSALDRTKPSFVVLSNDQSYSGWNDLSRILSAAYLPEPALSLRHFRVYRAKSLPQRVVPSRQPPNRLQQRDRPR